MTIPKRDSLLFKDRVYQIFWAPGVGLFKPSDWGLEATLWTTACRHGFVCNYRVSNDELKLMALDIVLRTGPGMQLSSPVPINGVDPHEWHAYGRISNIQARYRNIDSPVFYSGGMLVVRNFIMGAAPSRSHQPVHGFKEAHDLLFAEGRLVNSTDCSEPLFEVRRVNPYLDRDKSICDRCRPGMELIDEYTRPSRE
jgi:hypothetical protein